MTTTATIAARTVSVLIIEDDVDTADSLARFLQFGCGYFVATARDGLDGVRIAVENPPDVVVCDIGLPKKNGLLVAEELAEFLPRPLLIAVTGFGDQVSQGLAEAVGFDHFLLKPADPFRIKALIEGEAESLRDGSSALPGWPSGRPGLRSSRPSGPSSSIHEQDDGAGVPPGRPRPVQTPGPEPTRPGHASVAGPDPDCPTSDGHTALEGVSPMSTDVARSPTGLHVRFLDGPIDPPAWSWAEWGGVGYLTDPSGQVPPSLGLVFNKPGHGRRIFRSWRARFGSDGADAVLRVAVIEGPVTGYPPGYFVHLGADPGWAAAQAPVGRPAADPWAPVAGYVVHRVTPPTGTDYLAAFKAALARHGRYTLVPVLWGGCRFEPVPDVAVRMTRIQFRATADVGAGDIDRVCFGHEQGPGPGQKIGGERDGRQVSSMEVHRRWS